MNATVTSIALQRAKEHFEADVASGFAEGDFYAMLDSFRKTQAKRPIDKFLLRAVIGAYKNTLTEQDIDAIGTEIGLPDGPTIADPLASFKYKWMSIGGKSESDWNQMKQNFPVENSPTRLHFFALVEHFCFFLVTDEELTAFANELNVPRFTQSEMDVVSEDNPERAEKMRALN